MIPYILKDNSEYPLTDAISSIVTEERNGKYELRMSCDASGNNAELLELYASVFAKPNDDDEDQEFRIYRIAKTIKGRLAVYAEHVSYLMTNIIVTPFTITGTPQDALDALKRNSLYKWFNLYSNKTASATFTVNHPKSLRSSLLGEQGSVLQTYQGEWKFNNYEATLMSSRGKNTDVSIVYGKNITDITYDYNAENVYNGVFPYWFGEVDGVETLVQLSSNPVIYSVNHESFRQDRILALDLTSEFDAPPTESQLRTRAERYVAENDVGTPDISINVKFVPLWQVKGLEYLKELEKVALCDTVSVIVPHLNIATNAKVVETQYNVLKERYDSIKIGTVKKNFVGKISGDINDIRSVVNQLKRMR